MVRPGVVLAVVLALIAGPGDAWRSWGAWGPRLAAAADLPRALGMYPAGGPALAMLDSKVEVSVRGPIAEVLVTQRFQSRADHATEATYVFPLPADAAVTAMWIKTGSRTIRGAIERREDAQRRYEDAIRKGASAALLDQERPDVFTQTVAAIPAKGMVEVTLRYDTVARYRAGTWELVLPMVVAPRYAPGVATSRPTTGTGRAPDTDRAPDASRVTPPGGPGAGGATEVVVRFTDKVIDPQSPTHELRVAGAEAAFTDPKTDHDAIVRWRAAAPAAGWVEQGPDGGYAAVIIEAPAAAPGRRGAVRCLLVLDRSAASLGDADAVARPFVRALLGGLGGGDRAAVAGSDAIAWGAPADAARALEQAWEAPAGAFDLTRVLAGLRPEGGAVVLVTGGLVADDAAAVAAARRLGVPIHVIGVGPAPARGLLGQLAAATGGTLRYLMAGDDLGALAKATLADAATAPAPLAVNWGALAASDVVPGILPRLGAGQAILVLARVKQAQAANGRARGELFAIEALPAARLAPGATSAMGPLARRWARARLEELIAGRAAPSAIAAHALHYGLVSPYTSLVAVGDEVIVEGGVKRSVAVPVSVPAGMRWQAVKRQTTVDTGAKDATLSQSEADKREVIRNVDERGTRRGKLAAKEDDDDEDREEGREKGRDKGAKDPAKAEREKWKRPAGKQPDRDGLKKKTAERPAERAPTGPWRTGDRAAGKTGALDGDGPRTRPVPGTAHAPAGPAAPPPPPPPPEPRQPAPETAETGADLDEADQAVAPTAVAAAPRAMADEESEGDEGIATAELVSVMGRSDRRVRLSIGAGAGLVRDADLGGSSLLALSARLELGRRTLVGVGGSLWLTPGYEDRWQGELLATIARRGLTWHGPARWLELGAGLGAAVGSVVGPAASASLRLHLPPYPPAAAVLRYDGVLTLDEDGNGSRHAVTLGLEYGF
jgi:Ca-activated chloride channel family protein